MHDRRRKFLKSESEKKQWAEIDERYMTEESEESDSDNGFTDTNYHGDRLVSFNVQTTVFQYV